MSAVDPYPVAVVFSDSHLCTRTWKHQQIFGDSEYALKQIFDFAIDHSLFVIGAGDLIDKRINEPWPILALRQELKRLQENSLSLFFTQGQHEIDKNPWLGIADNAYHFHKKTFEFDSLKIYGLDYQPAGILQEELHQIPADTDVLISHQVWADFMGEIAHPQGEFADIPTVKTLVTGDLHKCVLETYKGKDHQDLLVFSPGATHMREISEPTSHYFGVLNSDGSIDIVNLRSRYFNEYRLTTEQEVEQAIESFGNMLDEAEQHVDECNLPEELQKPLCRIIYASHLENVVSRITKVAKDNVNLFWKELPQQAKDVNVVSQQVLDANDGRITLRSCLDEEIIPDDEPAAHHLATRLLDAEDYEAEMARWVEEQLN